jgi:O-antigen/teichoic acid export membrane protein
VGLGSEEGAATVVAVAAALSGAGALSLAIHAVVGSRVRGGARMARDRLAARSALAIARSGTLLRFGWPLVGRRGIDYLVQQGDRFVIGYALRGGRAWPVRCRPFALVRRVIDRIDAIFDRVAFPVFTHTGTIPDARGGASWTLWVFTRP